MVARKPIGLRPGTMSRPKAPTIKPTMAVEMIHQRATPTIGRMTKSTTRTAKTAKITVRA